VVERARWRSGMSRLNGKVALISGAQGGIGAAIASRFMAEGAAVVLGDTVISPVLTGGSRSVQVLLDVRSEGDWGKAVGCAIENFGTLTTLVNCAGIHLRRALTDMSRLEFEELIAVNLVGSWLGIAASVEPLRTSRGASIVNISSTAGHRGLAGSSAYSATKFAIEGLTKSAALELAGDSIRVNAVVPGPIATSMLSPAFDDGSVPLGRAGSASEVAALVAYLACDESSYCTGSSFVIDGGILSR
jgi:3alpha(or 20beta)-hydroxysteroid dehydrogenase